MTISATLKVCFVDFICPIGNEQFKFEADLAANYQGTQLFDVDVEGAAGLDFTSLRAPTVTDTGNAPVNGRIPFYRTVTVTFSEFTGRLDLGEIPVGTPLTVEYDMSARGEGRLIDNIGLAGINDPLVLETDPLPPGLSLTLVSAWFPNPERSPCGWHAHCCSAVVAPHAGSPDKPTPGEAAIDRRHGRPDARGLVDTAAFVRAPAA